MHYLDETMQVLQRNLVLVQQYRQTPYCFGCVFIYVLYEVLYNFGITKCM